MNRKHITLTTLAVAAIALTGCTSDADRVNENIGVAAENFEVNRSIIVVNLISDTVLFQVEGRCSIERDGEKLQAVCKQGPDDFRRQEVGLADQVTYVVTQLGPADVDEYSARIVFKPQNIVPNIDLLTGEEQ